MEVSGTIASFQAVQLPAGWTAVRLGDLACFRTGPFGSTLHQHDYVDGGVPVINPMQIVDGRLIPTPSMSVSESMARYLSEFRLSAGDVVIGRRGEMGRCACVTELQQGWLCGTGSLIIRVNAQADPRFIQRQLASPPIVQAIVNTSVGTTMVNLNNTVLKNLLIPLPQTRAEQEAIVGALADADAWIESLEKLIAKKRQIKQGVMQQLLTGKRRLPGFSGEWPEKRLGDLFAVSGGFSASRDQLGAEGVSYLHYGDIHTSNKYFIDVDAEQGRIPKLPKALADTARGAQLDDGDVVFVDASEDVEGTSKHVVIVNPNRLPLISGLHTIVARAKTNELDHGYRRYCFQTRAVRNQFRFFAVGTKVSSVSKGNIVQIVVPVPPVDEQREIAKVLMDADAEVASLDARLVKARLMKQGMMQTLLTGKVRLVEAEGTSC